MRNYVEPGEVLPFTAPAGGVVAGGLYMIGALLVVATVDAAAGQKFSAYIGQGVVEGPKDAGIWNEGLASRGTAPSLRSGPGRPSAPSRRRRARATPRARSDSTG